jgi:hypothetical protein
MARTDKTVAIRLLIRRGISPARIREKDAANAEQTSKRSSRGNISLLLGNVQTPEELEEARQNYRAKHSKAATC